MSENYNSTILIEPQPMKGFVQTQEVKDITARALNYLRVGFPIHFRGPTGTGKTTLALHLAYRLRQPVVMIHGDDKFTTEDLTGKAKGFSYKKHIDEFVRGVSKTEESMTQNWGEHRLTTAVRKGYTLLYDEFTRSRPEANNILLPILQEGVLDFPEGSGSDEAYLKVHPNFKAIFTSNPEEYAGVHKTQDALLDRMIALNLEHYDFETEVKITVSKTGLSKEDTEKIVNIVRNLRQRSKHGYLPTIRGCIMVAKSVKRYTGVMVSKKSPVFRKICQDVLVSEIVKNESYKEREVILKQLDELVDKYCPEPNRILNFFSRQPSAISRKA
jgi:nitric oxide reductase NorQ protein